VFIESTSGLQNRALSTSLSLGVEVEENATVYDSILMFGVRVGKGAQLRRVIVEEGAFIVLAHAVLLHFKSEIV
jgi:ADP-glucose pyrophosphorylase